MTDAFRFEQKIRNMMKRCRMVSPGQRILAAVSGGADSVCLLAVLHALAPELSFSLEAVHVEHGIRGEESLQDCAYVERLCGKLGVRLTVRHIHVPELARQSGRTEEEEARIQRYRIFEETAEQCGAQRVAVAHHLGDQAETVLWNLIRGSGLRGLRGILPVRPLRDGQAASPLVVRPLLETSREEIEQYLEACGLSYRTDRTNLDKTVTRNKIRHDILPDLIKLNAQAPRHIAQAAEEAAEAEAYLERVTARAAEGCIHCQADGQPVLLLARWQKEEPFIRRRLLRECIRRASGNGSLKDIGAVHVEALMGLACGGGEKSVRLPGELTAVRSYGQIRFLSGAEALSGAVLPAAGALYAQDARPGERWVEVPFPGRQMVHYGGYCFSLECGCAGESGICIPKKRFTKWIAYATIAQKESQKLCFRTRRPGDVLVVRQDGSRKKLSDYLIDEKIPLSLRDRVVLLAIGSEVLWVAGMRISEKARVTPGSAYVKVSCSTLEGQEVEDERECQCTDS
ncbi:MAG TPA: tRNA lysidine(34) synthetase TilS [Lachnospiraceae bacterium]|nr:tRNA lysidine(34) synthetase TilS [Lachnospiraceae bacterium]HCG60201.1 tRNA lysidine(34) synthetase TilS [Lachnospiraceae bacterium]